MSLFKPSPPKPPDPNEVAQAQTGQNIGTAIAQGHMNNINQRGPMGALNYNQIGTETVKVGDKEYQVPRYEAVQSLSPYQQGALNRQQEFGRIYQNAGLGLARNLQSTLSQPIMGGGDYWQYDGHTPNNPVAQNSGGVNRTTGANIFGGGPSNRPVAQGDGSIGQKPDDRSAPRGATRGATGEVGPAAAMPKRSDFTSTYWDGGRKGGTERTRFDQEGYDKAMEKYIDARTAPKGPSSYEMVNLSSKPNPYAAQDVTHNWSRRKSTTPSLPSRQMSINLGSGQFGTDRADIEGMFGNVKRDISQTGSDFGRSRAEIESRMSQLGSGFGRDRADIEARISQVDPAFDRTLQGLEDRFGNGDASREALTQSIIDRNQGNIDRDRRMLNERLAAQGFSPTTQASQNDRYGFQRGVNDFNLAAQEAGAQEHSRVNNLISGEHSRLMGLDRQRDQMIAAESARLGDFDQRRDQMISGEHSRLMGLARQRDQMLQAQDALGLQRSQMIGSEHSRRAGVKLNEAQFANRQREAAIQERVNLRNQQIMEAQALIGGAPIQQQNFVSTNPAQIANTDVAGIHMGNYAQQMQGYNAQSQGFGSLLGLAGQLGGAYIGVM